MLGDDAPAAVTIACSMPMSLTGTWRTAVDALRAVGMTNIYQGRGFGASGRVGPGPSADLWAPNSSSGSNVAAPGTSITPRGYGATPSPPPWSSKKSTPHAPSRPQSIVEAATANALAPWPSLRESAGHVGERLRDDLTSAPWESGSFTTLIGCNTTIITPYVT